MRRSPKRGLDSAICERLRRLRLRQPHLRAESRRIGSAGCARRVSASLSSGRIEPHEGRRLAAAAQRHDCLLPGGNEKRLTKSVVHPDLALADEDDPPSLH